LIDVVVLRCGGLAQIGEVSRPTLDLKSILVERVEEDRKIQRQQSDDDEEESDEADVERAMVVVMQRSPVQVMQTSAKSSTGQDTIDPRYETTRSAPAMS